MSSDVVDRLVIADLVNAWMHRDQGEWDKLRDLFHPDGIIEVTWFEGLFSDFVDASMHMGVSSLRTKHLIGTPMITFDRDRAIAETNAMIVGENVALALGCCVHNRFYDQLEKCAGVWRIVKRQSIYDMGGFTFPQGAVDVDRAAVGRYPREYAALAYILEKSGFPVNRTFATKGSALESAMKAAGEAWLRARK